MQFADRSGVHLDMARQARIGIAEIVYGEHKSAIQLREIARRHREAGADMLITRFGPVKPKTFSAAWISYQSTHRTRR